MIAVRQMGANPWLDAALLDVERLFIVARLVYKLFSNIAVEKQYPMILNTFSALPHEEGGMKKRDTRERGDWLR